MTELTRGFVLLAEQEKAPEDETRRQRLCWNSICLTIFSITRNIHRSKKLANIDKKKFIWLIKKNAHSSHAWFAIRCHIDRWLDSPCSHSAFKYFRNESEKMECSLHKLPKCNLNKFSKCISKCNLHKLSNNIGSSYAIVLPGQGQGKEAFRNSANKYIAGLIKRGFKKHNIFIINECSPLSIKETFMQVRRKNPERLYFMYCGHGEENKLHISKKFQPKGQYFQNLLKELHCSEYIIILDCCKASSIKIKPYFPKSNKRVRLFAVFTSSKHYQSAHYEPNEYSVYFRCLTAFLKGAYVCPSMEKMCRHCETVRCTKKLKLHHLQECIRYHVKLNVKGQTPQLKIEYGNADHFFFPSKF